MIKYLSTILLASAFSLVIAQAETVKVPSDTAAIASITFPETWETDAIDDGVAAHSSDGAVFMSVVAVENEKGMNAEIDDTFAMLKEHKVELDQSSKKENKFKIAGLDAEELLFQGKDADGPTAVSITFVVVKDKLLVITYWVSTNEEAAHTAEVGKIVESIKTL